MVARKLTRLGFCFGVGGLLAIATPWVDVISVTIPIGAIMIGAGIVFVFLAFEAQTWGMGMTPLLLALVGFVSGGCLLIWPQMGPVPLTALLATYFLLGGVLTLAFSRDLRPAAGCGRLLSSGLISLLLAASIWYQLPLSGRLAVGSLVGVDLLTMGFALGCLEGFSGSEPTASIDDRDMAI